MVPLPSPRIQIVHLTIIKLFVRHPSRNAGLSVKRASRSSRPAITIDDNFRAPLSLPTYVAGSESRLGSVMLSNHGIIPPSRGTIGGEDTRRGARGSEGRNEDETRSSSMGEEERLAEGTGVRWLEMPGCRDRYRVGEGGEEERRADRAVNQPRARLPISSLIISDNFSGPSELARPASSLFLRFFFLPLLPAAPRAASSRPRKSS